MVIFEHLYFTK